MLIRRHINNVVEKLKIWFNKVEWFFGDTYAGVPTTITEHTIWRVYINKSTLKAKKQFERVALFVKLFSLKLLNFKSYKIDFRNF